MRFPARAIAPTKTLFASFLFSTALVASAFAADRASPDEAKVMAERAALHARAVGSQAAGQDFSTPGGEWHDRDLYVFMVGKDGVMTAHGTTPALVGRDLTNLRDTDGKLFVQEYLKGADADGEWFHYKWKNTATGEVEAKQSYVISNGEYVVGVGAYTPN